MEQALNEFDYTREGVTRMAEALRQARAENAMLKDVLGDMSYQMRQMEKELADADTQLADARRQLNMLKKRRDEAYKAFIAEGRERVRVRRENATERILGVLGAMCTAGLLVVIACKAVEWVRYLLG